MPRGGRKSEAKRRAGDADPYGSEELIETETTVENWPASEAVHRDRGYALSPAIPGLSGNARRSFQLDASGPELRNRPY